MYLNTMMTESRNANTMHLDESRYSPECIYPVEYLLFCREHFAERMDIHQNDPDHQISGL